MKADIHFYHISIIIKMRNISGKVLETIKTHFLFSITYSPKTVPFLCNVKKYGTARGPTDNNVIRRMRFACSITKTTNTHSEYVILIALRRQHWLRERATLLRLYVHCLSF